MFAYEVSSFLCLFSCHIIISIEEFLVISKVNNRQFIPDLLTIAREPALNALMPPFTQEGLNSCFYATSKQPSFYIYLKPKILLNTVQHQNKRGWEDIGLYS